MLVGLQVEQRRELAESDRVRFLCQIVSCKHLLPAEETRETRETYVKAAENDHFGSRAPRRTGKSCRPNESPRERSSLGVRSGPEEYL